MDYSGNSKREKEGLGEPKPEKKRPEKVVGDTTEVIVKKKSFTQKVKGLFEEADLRGVSRYIVSDILIPSIRNLIVDASTKGIERVMYGGQPRYGVGTGPRYQYNNPIHRPYSPMVNTRPAPPIQPGPRRAPGQPQSDIILSSKSEGERVLEMMVELIDQYEVASVADLKDLVGVPTVHTDQKWGWVFLGDASVRQIREGYLLDLPPAEPIQ